LVVGNKALSLQPILLVLTLKFIHNDERLRNNQEFIIRFLCRSKTAKYVNESEEINFYVYFLVILFDIINFYVYFCNHNYELIWNEIYC
jgi:hypothetical protein